MGTERVTPDDNTVREILHLAESEPKRTDGETRFAFRQRQEQFDNDFWGIVEGTDLAAICRELLARRNGEHVTTSYERSQNLGIPQHLIEGEPNYSSAKADAENFEQRTRKARP